MSEERQIGEFERRMDRILIKHKLLATTHWKLWDDIVALFGEARAEFDDSTGLQDYRILIKRWFSSGKESSTEWHDRMHEEVVTLPKPNESKEETLDRHGKKLQEWLEKNPVPRG